MTSCLDSELGLFESSLLLERGLSRNTCTAYISDLRDFGAFLAARGVASVAAITRSTHSSGTPQPSNSSRVIANMSQNARFGLSLFFGLSILASATTSGISTSCIAPVAG